VPPIRRSLEVSCLTEPRQVLKLEWQERVEARLGAQAKKSAKRRQVAALPFKVESSGIQVMMITSRNGKRWLVPKGNPMVGRKAWTAAAREAFEEAGVMGRIRPTPLGRFKFRKRIEGQKRPVVADIFPLEVRREYTKWPEAMQRQRRWVRLSKATRLASWKGLAKALAGLPPSWLSAE
jgi:hypothetical protein